MASSRSRVTTRLSDVGWVLHRSAYRDTSLMVDVLTRHHGRLRCVSRGGRAARKASPIEPLQSYALSWIPGRGDLHTLVQADPELPRLRWHGEPMLCALYCSELLLRGTARDDADGVADLYEMFGQVLQELAEQRDVPDAALRAFELAILHAAGAGFDLRYTADGHRLEPKLWYRLAPSKGLVLTPGNGRDRVPGAATGTALDALAEGSLSADTPATLRGELRGLLADALAPIIGPAPLKSAAMLRQLRALRPGH